MSTPHTCDLAHFDGAYVLGALAPDERLEFERHLAGCASCSAAVRDLAGLPGLLGQVSADVVEHAPEPEPVPPTLLPTLDTTRMANGIAALPHSRSSTTRVAVAPLPSRRNRTPMREPPTGTATSDSTTVWSPKAL